MLGVSGNIDMAHHRHILRVRHGGPHAVLTSHTRSKDIELWDLRRFWMMAENPMYRPEGGQQLLTRRQSGDIFTAAGEDGKAIGGPVRVMLYPSSI